MSFKRVFLIVLDSLGVGASADAGDYGDLSSHTLNSVLNAKPEAKLDNLKKLGFLNLGDVKVYHNDNPLAYYGKLEEISVGKDTMTGHWELMGLKTTKPFVTFTDTGFPQELLDEITKLSNRNIVGNKAASGTEIIEEFGQHQLETQDLIVYTSADSVLQIAAHEDVIPLEELYDICEKTRALMMKEEWLVGRIIARPFKGEVGSFYRTSNRHDYALQPSADTVLDYLKDNNYETISVGKIYDIFDTKGLSENNKSKSNEDGMDITIDILNNRDFKGLCFVNLVDFDANYGHRRNPVGYLEALERFDLQLGQVLCDMNDDDLIMLVADHGNDPVQPGSDHTREDIPFLIYHNNMKTTGAFDKMTSFACVGATIAHNFDVQLPSIGSVVKF